MAEQLGAAVLQLNVDDNQFVKKLNESKALVTSLFGKEYRFRINDTQVLATNTRLDTTARKLKEITAQPYNVRLNFVQSGFGVGGGNQLSVGGIQKQIQEILQTGLSGQLQDIIRGGEQAVGGARTAEIRKSLLARLEKRKLTEGGFNLPGLEEIIRSLGEVPQARTAGRAALVEQARRVIEGASDAVINRIGKDLLDLQLNLNRATAQAGGGRSAGGGGSSTAAGRLLGPAGSTGGVVLLRPQEPVVPETLQRDFARLASLRNVLNNAEVGSNRFVAALSEIEVVQRRIAEATDGASEAFRRQQQAAEGAERRLEKLTQIQEFYAALNERAGGVRDPDTGAMLARGAGAAADERAFRASLGASRELLEVDLARNRAIRERQQLLAEAQRFREVSTTEGFAARPDAVQKSIRRNQEKRAREEARQTAQRDRLEADLVGTQERRRQEQERQAQSRRDAAELQAQNERDRQRRTEAARNRRRDIASNALIGGAFPALFGQGLGASLGGLVGGGLGGAIGGQFGFGLSLIGTALGAQFDLAVEKAKTLAQALNDPIGQFDALRQAALLSSKGLERQVQGLINVGREADAARLIQADLAQTFTDATALRNYNNSLDDLNRAFSQLSVRTAAFIVGPLADLLSSFNFAVGAGGIEQQRRDQIAQQANVAVGLDRFGQEAAARQLGIILPISVSYKGKVYKGSASEVRDAIIKDLSATERKTQTALTAGLAAQTPEAVASSRSRADILTKELQVIAAQTQGYTKLALERQKALSLAQQEQDIQRLQATNATAPELEQRRIQGSKERFQIQEQLNKLERESAITEQFRGPVLAAQLEIIKAQTNSEERRALVLQQQLVALQEQQKLKLEPGRAGQIRDDAALEQARIAAQITELDRSRASELRTISTETAVQAGALQRQLQFARERAAVEQGIGRTSLEQRQAVEASIAAARDNLTLLTRQYAEARLLGNETGAVRLAGQLKNAGTELQLALTNGANTLRDAGSQLVKDSESLAAQLTDATLRFTAVRGSPTGLNQFLPQEVRSQREIQNFNILLPLFRTAQQRFQQLTGVRAREFAGPTGALNTQIEKFIQLTNDEFGARNNVAETQRNLISTNDALNKTNAALAEAVNALAAKNWGVSVNVQADGTATAIGDVLTGAAGAL